MPISSKPALMLGLATLFLSVNNAVRSADPAPAEQKKEDTKKSWRELGHWWTSRITFAPTLHANDYLGQGPCTFHSMLAPFDPQKKHPYTVFDQNDNIIEIYDAQKAPLCLGNIPRSADHFKRLRDVFGLPADAKVGLYTLNRRFEQKYVWLPASIKEDGQVTQHHYRTIDFYAPSDIDIVRATSDLSARDLLLECIALVHCKAGKGRSGVVTIAYEIHVYHCGDKIYADGTPYTKTISNTEIIDQIIKYSKTKRSVININGNQRPALDTFFANLQKAGSLQALYIQNTQAIIEREKELKKLNS